MTQLSSSPRKITEIYSPAEGAVKLCRPKSQRIVDLSQFVSAGPVLGKMGYNGADLSQLLAPPGIGSTRRGTEIIVENKSKHPQHDQVAQTVREWFREPFESMGYRSDIRTFGTYWNTGMVFPSPAAVANLADFLADLHAYYGPDQVIVNLDDSFLQTQLGPLLVAAGWTEDASDMFLAHIGPGYMRPQHAGLAQPSPGATAVEIEPATEANLKDLAITSLIAFDDVESGPDDESLAAEMARRREELAGNGRGMLARVDGLPAGIMLWFEEALDIWLRVLAVRPAFRGQGIGSALINRLLEDGYAAGRRSLVINVALRNDGARRLYNRLGFVDEVYRRVQFASPDPD